MTTAPTSSYLDTLEQVITNVIAAAAFEVDRKGGLALSAQRRLVPLQRASPTL